MSPACAGLFLSGRPAPRSACGNRMLHNILYSSADYFGGKGSPDDAPVRTRRAGQALQPLGRRGAPQPHVYAMMAHGNQKRASGDLYFGHPLEVAAILTDMKLDEATIAAAVLHDTIEDTTATLEEINKTFGRQIGSLVDGLTKLKLDLVSKRAAQGENFRKLLLAIADDVRVLLVKLADRLHNMRTLQFMPPDKRKRIAEETLEIYAPLAGRMGIQEMREELEDLSFQHIHPEAHQTISATCGTSCRRARSSSTRSSDLVAKFQGKGLNAKVKGRQKRPYSIWRKMERKSVSFEQPRHLRVPRARGHHRRMLPRAWRRPYHLADGPRPLQGLHLDPEAERLPLDPHR